jgi:glutathione synthase/RimK-type ligase-like ATP-grasp enzyme
VILAISYPDEDHTQAVLAGLGKRNIPCALLNQADYPSVHPLAAIWGGDTAPEARVKCASGWVQLSEVRAAWWRRTTGYVAAPEITDPAMAAFAVSETHEALEGLLDTLDCPWMNPRAADTAAHHKPLQWSRATQVGLNLPDTLITNAPEQARAFVDRLGLGRVVVKPFLATHDVWRETRKLTTEDLERFDQLRLAPVILQEFIDGVDLRITCVGQQLFTAEIDARKSSFPSDMRMVLGESVIAPLELPTALQSALLALMRSLRLEYGAIDMRRTDDGRYAFFEVNPAGQWLFAEHYTGLPITAAVTQHLAHLGGYGGQ